MNERRRFDRLARDQGQQDWWSQLAAQEPKEAEKALRSYSKHARASTSQPKFSIVEHRRHITQRHGVRSARKSKWMWSEEFYENMQKKKYGGYSELEAKTMWQQMLASNQKRKMGPRGHVMFKIKQGDFESSFSELESENELVISGPVRKKQSAGDIQAAADGFLSNTARSSAPLLGKDEEESSTDEERTAPSRLRRVKESVHTGPDVRAFTGPAVNGDAEESAGEQDAADNGASTKGKRHKPNSHSRSSWG